MKNNSSEKEIIPTVVPNALDDVLRVRSEYAQFATQIHVDAADGVFAPNTTWIPNPDEMLPDSKKLFYEAHMMVSNPLSVGVSFARAGAKRIIAHVEAFAHAESTRETFAMWRSAGAVEVGLGILLTTPLEAIVPYANLCDCVCVMTIETVGTQGIPFSARGIERVKELHELFPSLCIQVDGGVSEKNIAELSRAGASRFAVGSAIQKSPDPQRAYNNLLAQIE